MFYVQIYICIHMYMCIHIYIYAYIYIHSYIYMENTEIDVQAYIHTKNYPRFRRDVGTPSTAMKQKAYVG